MKQFEFDGIPIKSIKRSLQTALKRAGIEKKIRPYALRHMHATQLIKNGTGIIGTGVRMGHKFISTTKRHIQSDAQSERADVDKLPALKTVNKNRRRVDRGKVVYVVPRAKKRLAVNC